MKNKKGGVASEAPFELILGVVSAVLIISLILILFAPGYNEAGEIAESYLERLKEAVGLADNDESADFFILDNGDKELDIYLVYFGELSKFTYGDIDFVNFKFGKNVVCFCYRFEKSVSCKSCMNLDLPALRLDKGEEDFWVVGEGSRIEVFKNKEEYSFNAK